MHSAFPTTEADSVFLGPDTYRFVRFLRTALADITTREALRLVDIGAGSGVGGIIAAKTLGASTDLVLADINRNALAFSAVNATLNDLPEERRLYRHGGGELWVVTS